jgi:hypothetical protein
MALYISSGLETFAVFRESQPEKHKSANNENQTKASERRDQTAERTQSNLRANEDNLRMERDISNTDLEPIHGVS